MIVGAVIVAAGRGARMGGMDKGALQINGRSALSYSLAAFAPIVPWVVVVVAADRVAQWERIRASEGWPVQTDIVPGGAQRQDSVRLGVAALGKHDAVEVVAIHDGARPLVTTALIRACIEVARQDGAAIAAVPMTDTIKRVIEGTSTIVETPDRAALWAAQTPQAFRRQLLLDALAWAANSAQSPMTDEASLVEAYGHPVHVVRGERRNIKLTEPDDLIVARALLQARTERHDG